MLIRRVLIGIDPERGEPSRWALPDLCRFIEERFGKTMGSQSMSRVVRLDGAGRHDQRSVTVPANITLVPLPPYCPKLNIEEISS